jgi:peptidoglycan/LPS O-acetylase OafA/YrhL
LLGGATASGVELFFVLSAIVLAGPYVRGDRAFDLRIYFWRRLTRLWPPFAAAWVLAGLAIWLAGHYPTWWTVGASLPTFELSDWLAQLSIVYAGRYYNFAWWSLAVEVAFYVLLPFIIPLFRGISKVGRAIAFSLSILISTFAAPLMIDGSLMQSIAVYASCFCAGIILSSGTINRTLAALLIASGCLWTLCAVYFSAVQPHVGWGLMYFGAASLAMDPGSRVSRLLSGYGFVWIGERSYSLFLVHYSVIGLVCHAVSALTSSKSAMYFLLTRGLSIPLIGLATVLTFHLVERRFARGLMTGADLLPNMAGRARFIGKDAVHSGASA